MIRISDFKVNIDKEIEFKEILRKKLDIKDEFEYNIVKKSIDARDKNDILFVYTVDINVSNEENFFKRKYEKFNISISKDIEYVIPKSGDLPLQNRPVVVGFGPAGMFAGLILARCGFRPIIIERGKDIEERHNDVKLLIENRELNPESNIQFGIGGAGTYSDGKLNTLVKDKYGRNKFILEEMVNHGAPEEILYLQKPHVGTDRLMEVVKSIKEEIERLGGEIKFNSRLSDIVIENNYIKEIIFNNTEHINTEVLILCIGHSARDTFYMLKENNLEMEAKPFAIGVRIEHNQEMINKSQYGDSHTKLPPADYKLVHHLNNGRTVYTFCMCPGGLVVPATSEEGMVVTNGMSNYLRDTNNSNSALLVNVSPEDFGSNHPLAGIEFQREWEKKAFLLGGSNYNAPAQLVGEFIGEKAEKSEYVIGATYRPGITFTNLEKCLPNFVTESLKEGIIALDKKIRGFASSNAILTGVETRSSSPVRIVRDESFESNIKGIYPTGEGAGYAGGIMSSAMDGLKVAETIISKFCLGNRG